MKADDNTEHRDISPLGCFGRLAALICSSVNLGDVPTELLS